jgi:hypothetical protein
MGSSGDFIINPKTYQLTGVYPASPSGHLMTQYLNGYSFALCTFTPVLYHPASGQVSYYHKVIVRVKTQADKRSAEAMKFLSGSEAEKSRVNSFAQNPDLMTAYPQPKAPVTDYQYLIICPTNFQTEFQSLIDLYATKGIITHVTTVDYISTNFTGYDLQEKIRNYIINQKQNYHIQYVLLAGNPALVPCRGFFCHVWSGGAYTTDYNIPADLYYSGLDGNYDANGNHTYAEEDDNADLLPDVAVGRFTVNDTAELHHMLHKSIAYQTNPVLGEFSRPLFIGEYLWGAPLTMGGDFMNLLIDYHTDNGYNTQGIPSASNSIRKLYDTLIPPTYTSWWSWGQSDLFSRINQGNSFMHHLGHANTDYMLRLNYTDITNSNFSQVDGIIHNYEFLYTQGCYCGAFDLSNCIAVKSVTITNFLAGGVFNSRYGWFDEGSTDGPSEHLQREFVNAMYRAVSPEKHLGMAQVISKVNTAPYIGLPGEWEPGAQRWCHFCCNVYGDPALELWTAEPSTFTTATWNGSTDSDWNSTTSSFPMYLSNL